MDSNKSITVKDFHKSFGDLKVTQDLNFEVEKGEIFAFLGANGSGKTTTIRCLLNIYQADKGKLLIHGKKYNSKMSSILGYLPEERGLYTTSKVLETMIYFGELKGLTKQESKKRSLNYLDEIGLADKANIEIKKLSSGQQQKIQLGITIINNPELLILDEPTKGLDPVNRQLLLDKLMDLHKNGSTIFFSTHQMEEVEKIADRMLMLKNGTAKLYGKVDEIKKSFGENIIKMKFNGKFPKESKLYSAKVENNYAELTPKNNTDPEIILKALIPEEFEIKSFEVATPSLNDIFVKISNQK